VGTTNISTGSTTYVLMTGMSVTLNTGGGDVLVHFTTTIQTSANGADADIGLFVDGTHYFAVRNHTKDSNDTDAMNLSYLVTGLSAGSHTFQIRWRVNTGTVLQSASTWAQYSGVGYARRTLIAVELP
jgi:hypothetical protein